MQSCSKPRDPNQNSPRICGYTRKLVLFRDQGDVVVFKVVVLDFKMLDVGNSSLNV